MAPPVGRAGLVALRDRLASPRTTKRRATDGTESDRPRQFGVKVHLTYERNRLPLSPGIAGATTHGDLGLEPLVPPVHATRPPSRRPLMNLRPCEGDAGGGPRGRE